MQGAIYHREPVATSDSAWQQRNNGWEVDVKPSVNFSSVSKETDPTEKKDTSRYLLNQNGKSLVSNIINTRSEVTIENTNSSKKLSLNPQNSLKLLKTYFPQNRNGRKFQNLKHWRRSHQLTPSVIYRAHPPSNSPMQSRSHWGKNILQRNGTLPQFKVALLRLAIIDG